MFPYKFWYFFEMYHWDFDRNCFEYVDFCKQYSTQGIYHFGFYENREIGYNSILLSPNGTSWAKNFSKIIFLSPVIDEKFISALNRVTDAEIYIPIDKQGGDPRKFSGLDISRECFGKVFKALSSKAGKAVYNVFDLYDRCELSNISFFSFYSAMLVFNELGIISVVNDGNITIKVNKGEKNDLTNSRIYNRLKLIKDTQKGEIDYARHFKRN